MGKETARWSKATINPAMWADPDDDPRDSGNTCPDGELATLRDYLRNYILTLWMRCEGLDPEQLARRSVPPSTMSLLGLRHHLAEVEQSASKAALAGHPDLLRECIDGRTGQ